MGKLASERRSKVNEKERMGEQNRNPFIKKVILENFLSFHKDEIDFEEAKFVIIVGPNWSGKTSVFQAIKFALGSNERDKRYKKWSNFIRNGQNHAMVEIHIQNEDDLIKIRRFVIRGQSPYFKIQYKNDKDFQKIQVNEIQKIITDLNINPDNQFAFVSQGKIDSIKSLKPTELCLFLEEGIGLKTLRDEILNQKVNVNTLNNDLKSLSSRKNVLNLNLELITPKLERLKQKNELLEVRRKYTDELLWANRDKLEKDIDKIEEYLKNLKLVIGGIKKRKEKFDTEIAELVKKINREDQNLNNLSKKLGELGFKKKDLIAKIQNWQNDKILAKQEIDALSKIVGEIKKIVLNFEKQKESITSELKLIKKERKNLEIQIENLIREQDQLAKKIKQNKVYVDEYNNIVEEKKTRLAKIQENEKITDFYLLDTSADGILDDMELNAVSGTKIYMKFSCLQSRGSKRIRIEKELFILLRNLQN